MQHLTREEIAELILKPLTDKKDSAVKMFSESEDTIGYFYIDNILPKDLAKLCGKVFPKSDNLKCLNSIKEYKYVSAQMDRYHPILEEVLYAFQDKKILEIIEKITKIEGLKPDPYLYAGGLSLMEKDNFLNPHLDNSHDANREYWRVLNLLFYVTPDWNKKNGGHLELWPNGPKKSSLLIESKFNRLVVMATHNNSWHSVSKVKIDRSRCCISNYYFCERPLRNKDSFHITIFKGRPNEYLKDLMLYFDTKARTLVRKVFKKGIRKNPHIYKNRKSNN